MLGVTFKNTVEPLMFASLLFQRLSQGGADSRKLEGREIKSLKYIEVLLHPDSRI